MTKTLDQKLAALHENPDADVFILADAKDADMAFGIAATGPKDPETGRHPPLEVFRERIRDVVRQGLVDIMLMSASTSERLALDERLFEDSPVTPAARVNDSTDIHLPRAGLYQQLPSLPFRSATLAAIQRGRAVQSKVFPYRVDLGLYSVTFNNHPERDVATLEQFKAFRIEAESHDFRYFLEVFDPNVPGAVPKEELAGYLNDMIVRSLAGVTASGRPLFLKMPYHGPRALEELRNYDPSLVVGILGGAGGTTYDAFKLLAEARKHGASAALFGRKINQADDQLLFVEHLRRIASGDISPEEAVKAYHAALEKRHIKPRRSLDADSKLTLPLEM